MTREETIHKLEYIKKAYQMLIDEKVDSGKLVGKDIIGMWKANTPLDAVYQRCGCEPVWASEIEEFPIAVTKIRFSEGDEDE